MKGERLLLAAAAVDCAQDYLGGLEAASEVLGFTTRAWRGGRARRDWYLSGSKPNPGRLNELLHIVFKRADDNRHSLESWSFRQMFRPGLLKENIDGEAIEWAIGRLRSYPADRRVLVVLADGAPVDDATMLANGVPYLREHLMHVLADAKAEGDVEVAALGIGYDVSKYYSISERANTPSELGERLIALLERMLTARVSPAP
jgi:cobaltochelatase CobT